MKNADSHVLTYPLLSHRPAFSGLPPLLSNTLMPGARCHTVCNLDEFSNSSLAMMDTVSTLLGMLFITENALDSRHTVAHPVITFESQKVITAVCFLPCRHVVIMS